jgi:hypothetical protein
MRISVLQLSTIGDRASTLISKDQLQKMAQGSTSCRVVTRVVEGKKQ